MIVVQRNKTNQNLFLGSKNLKSEINKKNICDYQLIS